MPLLTASYRLEIVGRRRWAMESHFLMAYRLLLFVFSHGSLLWCNTAGTSLCNAPACAQRNVSHLWSLQQVTTPQTQVCVVADVDSKNRFFFVSFYLEHKLVRVSQRHGAGSFQSPTFSDLVLTTTATTGSLQQTCPDQHFPTTNWPTFKEDLPCISKKKQDYTTREK
jgi:hypothetical protein